MKLKKKTYFFFGRLRMLGGYIFVVRIVIFLLR
jgi:hypothetical protein